VGCQLANTKTGFNVYAIRDPSVSITCSHANLSINFANKNICLTVLDLVEALDWLCKSIRTSLNKDGHFVLSASYHLERVTITQDSVHGSSRSPAI